MQRGVIKIKNVLIVDDTKANRIFMAKCLEYEGYEVTAVNSGKQAKELLERENYKLIILDVKMPSMSGTQLLKWIRKNYIKTKVIMVTAYGTVRNAIECINNGAIEYIQKPFTMNRFRKCICDIEKKIEHEYIFKKNITETMLHNTMEANLDTEYATAERMSDDVILRQAEEIIKQNTVTGLFDMIPYSILILNNERQIIYSNNYFLKLLGIKLDEEVNGLRPGEILKCVHSSEKSSGCGTTEYCSVCGAVEAILESQEKKISVSKECLMTSEGKNKIVSIELLIYAAPAGIINNEYTILVIKDISHEKRRQAIEKTFFHDILNTSGVIRGLVDCVSESLKIEESRELINCVSETTDIMIDEIKTQIDLVSAESGELKLNLLNFSLKQLILKLIKYHESIIGCKIKFECEDDFVIESDKVLILRVVNNMVKNALEDSEDKLINIGIRKKERFIEIYADNKKYMPRDIQLQIFKRSFSTKGKGRGLGTYSMKLIGENYLKGYVKFTSDKENGTRFMFGLPYEK
ncbi:MAG: response regulator [Clostridium sp.]|uniref:response regulator n=1 Tax=Clostridium sp. TaxID=1506 RepID=UPI0039EA1E30